MAFVKIADNYSSQSINSDMIILMHTVYHTLSRSKTILELENGLQYTTFGTKEKIIANNNLSDFVIVNSVELGSIAINKRQIQSLESENKILPDLLSGLLPVLFPKKTKVVFKNGKMLNIENNEGGDFS